MKTVAVLGANGRLGQAAMHAFCQENYHVIAITRTGQARHLPDGVEQRSADALNPQALQTATTGADFIFNGLNPPYTEWQQKALPMAQNVIEAARRHGAVHLFPGNVYNYGNDIPAVCTPQTPFHANTRKGSIRITMEQLFADAAQQHGVQTLVLRAGDFYGGGSGTWFDMAITSKLSKGILTYPGSLDVVHTWAYLPDLARAFVVLAGQHEKLGRFENILFPGHALTGTEWRGLLETALDKPLKTTGMPWWLIKTGGLVVPMWRELTEMAYLWFRPHRLEDVHRREIWGDTRFTPAAVAIGKALNQG